MAQIARTITDGSYLAFKRGFSNSVSAGRLIYSPHEKHLFPSLGQKRASEGVFGGGSHLPENEGWLPGVSAGQRIYSPYEGNLFPYAGYQLATTLEACFPVRGDTCCHQSDDMARGGRVFGVCNNRVGINKAPAKGFV